ncbi:hypothetical protein [Modestobacter italicus]|uniref:hypothetical protein n=1 Tax=Modestobacter italicus (strain DSM 44449 / CECT 9708 / BC 501) TaxID=2732864 RepID=UPI001C97ADC1|nr:hypothetical protein [Modestobacter italicus]
MIRRVDHLVTGIGLVVAAAVLLAVLLATGGVTAPRVVGAALLAVAGALFVVSSRRVSPTSAGDRLWTRDRTAFGLLLVLGAVEVALWSVGTPDSSGRWGVATGFLVVGVVLVITGRRS